MVVAMAEVEEVSTAAVVTMAVARSMGAAIHAGGFRTAHVFHGGGFRHGGFAFRHHRRHFFYGASYYDYPFIITRTAVATLSGPITARGASATIATGATTIAGIITIY